MAGKRQFRRTTSMTGITVDFEEPAGPQLGFQIYPITGDPVLMDLGSGGPRDHSLMAAMVSPRHNRRRNNYPTDNNNTNDRTEMTAHFLRTCGLCQRRLAPGRDIYMYRGDTAFCSLECREQQMKHDERKNKCCMVAPNSSSRPNEEYHHHHHGNYSETSAATSDASGGKTETFAAA